MLKKVHRIKRFDHLVFYKKMSVSFPTSGHVATHLLTFHFNHYLYCKVCPPVCEVNPGAKAGARGLSPIQVDNYEIAILYHLHKCRYIHSDISRAGHTIIETVYEISNNVTF